MLPRCISCHSGVLASDQLEVGRLFFSWRGFSDRCGALRVFACRLGFDIVSIKPSSALVRVSKRFFGLFAISVEKRDYVLMRHVLDVAREQGIWDISVGIRIMFCSIKITLAFQWRACVNNRERTRVSVAAVIKSSKIIMLLYRGLI